MLFEAYLLTSAKRRTKDTNCQFCPNEQEDRQHGDTERDPALEVAYLPHNQLT